MTVEEAREFFDAVPVLCAKIANIDRCGFILYIIRAKRHDLIWW